MALLQTPSRSDTHRAQLQTLAQDLARLQSTPDRSGVAAVATSGAPAIDDHLPGGGLRLGALHEVTGRGATGFATACAGRIAEVRPGLVVWCQHRRRVHDEGRLYGPGLGAFGLDGARLLVVDAEDDGEGLWVLEEALRSTAVAVAVGEIDALDLFHTRRLQLAAEAGGGAGILLRPATPALLPSAAVTRWQVMPHTTAELGPPAWTAELWRVKGAVPARFEVSFDEQTLRFAVVATLADRSFPAGRQARG
ncbi:MAG: hypothetical protein AAFX81_16430 [Pseudomonadota bacterium]